MAECTHGRQQVWTAEGWVWQTWKVSPTDASTGTLMRVRASLYSICGGGTAGADGRTVQRHRRHIDARARGGRIERLSAHTVGSKCGKQGGGECGAHRSLR
eukprot:scaffold5285_cov137-Isochrysis_galbana.AAC.7